MSSRRRHSTALVMIILLGAATASLTAHDRKTSGPFQLTIGWGDEPAFSGSRNSVVVALADSGGPLKDPAASLSVEIAFGSERITLPLEPAWGRPHEYRAWLVPTRAGTYTFRITGKVRGQAIDVTSTCAENTFHCVADASEIQFPVKDPSAGQLADRISRALPRAERAADTAVRAERLAIAALALSGLGVVALIAIAVRKRRTHV